MFFNQRTFIFLSIIIVAIVGAGRAKALSYQSYVFGTYEIILFSYEDGTDLEVYDTPGWTGTSSSVEPNFIYNSDNDDNVLISNLAGLAIGTEIVEPRG